MARVVDAAAASSSWVSGMSGAGPRYIAGVNKVTESPMAKAATPQAMQKYLDNVQRSVQSGKRAAALNNSPLATWKANAVGEGANRLAGGARKGKSKVDAHFQKWAPIYSQASQAAEAVPYSPGVEGALAKSRANLQVIMGAAGTA